MRIIWMVRGVLVATERGWICLYCDYYCQESVLQFPQFAGEPRRQGIITPAGEKERERDQQLR
jgi:hypothetical protein